MEYFEIRAFGRHIDGSRLFVFKATRNLMGVSGDTGAWLRTTMAALVLCGIAPERYWKDTDKKPDFDEEPPHKAVWPLKRQEKKIDSFSEYVDSDPNSHFCYGVLPHSLT